MTGVTLSRIIEGPDDSNGQFTATDMTTLLFGIGVIAAIGLSLYGRATLNPMTSGDLVYRDEEPGTYWFGIVLYVLIAAGSLYVHFHPQCFS